MLSGYHLVFLVDGRSRVLEVITPLTAITLLTTPRTKRLDALEVITLLTVTLLAYTARQTVLTEAARVLEDIILLPKMQELISSLVAPS